MQNINTLNNLSKFIHQTNLAQRPKNLTTVFVLRKSWVPQTKVYIHIQLGAASHVCSIVTSVIN